MRIIRVSQTSMDRDGAWSRWSRLAPVVGLPMADDPREACEWHRSTIWHGCFAAGATSVSLDFHRMLHIQTLSAIQRYQGHVEASVPRLVLGRLAEWHRRRKKSIVPQISCCVTMTAAGRNKRRLVLQRQYMCSRTLQMSFDEPKVDKATGTMEADLGI